MCRECFGWVPFEKPLAVRIVSVLTGTDSIDVLEDRGSAVFTSRTEAETYLKERDFDASLAIVESNYSHTVVR